jgi:hypothetical protein
MAYDDLGLLRYDEVLTGFSVGYQNDQFVGAQLMPTVGVPARSGKYNVMEKVGFTVLDDIRAPKAKANEVPPITYSRDTYFAEEHALVDFISNEEIDESDNQLDPMRDASERLSDTILMNKEFLIVTLATTLTNYASGHSTTLSGTSQWNDYTNSDPIANLKVARDIIHLDTFKFPNVAVLGYDVATKLEDHTKIIDRFKYVEAGMTTFDMIARLVGSPGLTFYKGGAVKNTANLGQTQTMAYMWGKDVVLAYVNPRPTRKSVSYGYEYNFPIRGATQPTERWYDDDHKATKVRVSRRYDLKLFAVDTVASGKSVAGYLIKTAVA